MSFANLILFKYTTVDYWQNAKYFMLWQVGESLPPGNVLRQIRLRKYQVGMEADSSLSTCMARPKRRMH